MKTAYKTISLPREWNIDYDFSITALGDSMIEYGITSGMLVFIKEQDIYENDDIVAIKCKNWINPLLTKIKKLSTGETIFYSPGGPIIEKNNTINILGRMVFKMDNPCTNRVPDEQLDFWN